MAEFFRGWKRKVGVVTLVMACVFASAWVRSTWMTDTVQLNSTIGMVEVRSLSGITQASFHHRGEYFAPEPLLDWQCKPFGEFERGYAKFHPAPLVCGYVVWDQLGLTTHSITIPYRTVVAPLTLITAWLLFSKPRRTQKRPTPRRFEIAGNLS